MLDVRGVRKSYDKGKTFALDGVDLSLERGQILGLLGPNGAGKTTLVSIITGLRRPDEGSVTVAGIDAVGDSASARRHLGVAPQELGIFPTLTVMDNLRFFGELADLRGDDLRRRIGEVVDALELGSFADRKAHSLSGGEKRRLHTAMAMLHRPPLLLLDEPTTGVDVRTRANLIEVVRQLAAGGTAVCYSTHYLPEVEALDACVAILERGRIIARGEVRELVRAHGTCAVELTFADDAKALPRLRTGHRVERTDSRVLRVFTAEPGEDVSGILDGLGRHRDRLRSLEIVTPSLESVFLALTGRRYESDATAPVGAVTEEVA